MSYVISPTSLKQRDECDRAGLLYQAAGRDKYDPLHSLYGSAFGLGCAAYATHPRMDYEARRGLAFIKAATLWGHFQKIETKDWNNMVRMLTAFCNAYDRSDADGLETETRILVEVTSPELVWTLGGTFDLLSRDGDGCFIDDFKAVASEYFYAWEADPQILHYTLLQYIRSQCRYGVSRPSKLGMYYVGVLPANGEISLHLRRNHAGMWRTLESHVHKAKAQAMDFNKAAVLGLSSLPTNPHTCSGRRPCFFTSQCYDGETFVENWQQDARKPDRTVHISISEAELWEYVAGLTALLQADEVRRRKYDEEQSKLLASLESAALFNLDNLEVSTNGYASQTED